MHSGWLHLRGFKSSTPPFSHLLMDSRPDRSFCIMNAHSVNSRVGLNDPKCRADERAHRLIRQVLPQVIKGRTMTQERSLPEWSHYETCAATASVEFSMNAALKRMPERRTCFYGCVWRSNRDAPALISTYCLS